ncbi:MAG: ATP phosphoribosyltransferase regulatory subunit [Solirubrobacterales bacterium]|nr:ATP phosphoribosyltransferase regulatory subunit [Solirubrobacterales bacterium]
MTRSIPTGTRNILPEEMRELRSIESTLAGLFDDRGYGEVATPAIEHLEAAEASAARLGSPAYQFFDESGASLALRSDMTVPIARLVATRYRNQEGPFRFRYSDRIFRPVQPQRGEMRELHQVGIELIGAEAPGGTIEVVELLVGALDAIGLERAVIGLGDADLFRQLLDELEVEGPARDRILSCLESHDLVAIEAEAGDLAGIGDAERRAIVELSNLRGGADVLTRARAIGGQAVERAGSRLAETFDGLEAAGIADRVQLDLGLLRDLGYYTGAILEVYDPALGSVLGGGGRYDMLLDGFGRMMPAAGFALYLDRLHIAQAAQRARTDPRREPARGGEAP